MAAPLLRAQVPDAFQHELLAEHEPELLAEQLPASGISVDAGAKSEPAGFNRQLGRCELSAYAIYELLGWRQRACPAVACILRRTCNTTPASSRLKHSLAFRWHAGGLVLSTPSLETLMSVPCFGCMSTFCAHALAGCL